MSYLQLLKKPVSCKYHPHKKNLTKHTQLKWPNNIAKDLKLVVNIEYELFTVNGFILRGSSVVIGINVFQLAM